MFRGRLVEIPAVKEKSAAKIDKLNHVTSERQHNREFISEELTERNEDLERGRKRAMLLGCRKVQLSPSKLSSLHFITARP